MMLNTNRTRDRETQSYNQSSSSSNVSAVGEKKKLKVQFLQNAPNVQSTFNLQINPKNWPNLKVDDILEVSSISNNSSQSNQLNNSMNRSNFNLSANNSTILNANSQSVTYQQQTSMNEDDSSPILFQVVAASLNESVPLETIRIDPIAGSAPFSFKTFTYVNVTVVDKSSVVLDLVELLFREQYFNGNDMLRIKKYMNNTCVFLKKNIEFCGMRCSVRQMWAPNGDTVTCGYINEKTRLVFRSQSAMCTIYIQMSREMWEFDVNGEMYHEKAVNFLGELFTNWKNQACTHDVTIALFSRIFYDAKSLEDFPSSISRHVKKDHKNRFYEDFYRVIYQNERFEDWTPTLIILKRLIKEYRDYILNYHKRQFGPSLKMPAGLLSSAAEGNFLETLILSSNVFERHFIDRPFDRTGMMSLVITPGNGLFEVSRELSKITKERVIDNAIGSDLVCLGEQPLHSVPLFKYEIAETYDIPHWINLSFYKSSDTVRYCNSKFLPSSKIKIKYKSKGLADCILPDYNPDKNNYLKSLEETDNMFENLDTKTSQEILNTTTKNKPTSRVNTIPNFQTANNQIQFNQNGSLNRALHKNRRNQSTFNTLNNFNDLVSKRTQDDIASKNCNDSDDQTTDNDDDSSLELESDNDTNEAASMISKRNKSKVNPFAPSSVKPKMSFERRRWAHTFPLRSDGTPIYQHWTSVQTNNEFQNFSQSPLEMNGNTNINFMNNENSSDINKVSPDSNRLSSQSSRHKLYEVNGDLTKHQMLTKNNHNLKNNFNWEIVHKDETKALMRPGVAWKSLTTPACLPLTTDFFPNKKTWVDKFIQSSNYSLLLDEIRDQYGYSNYHYNIISMEQVFYELVGHRLAMGFQMVVPKDTFTYTMPNTNTSSNTNGTKETSNQTNNNLFICDLTASTSVIVRNQFNSIKGYYKLSLGRIYHELFYIVDKLNKCDYIKVEIYMPKKKVSKDDKEKENLYTYRFQVPDSKTYDISFVKMTRKNTESIKWNLIDSYICIQGNGSLTPSELKKCWRQRIYLIPIMFTSSNKFQQQSGKSLVINQLTSEQIQPASPNSLTSKNNLNNHFEYNLTVSHFNIQTPGMIPASMLETQEHPFHCDIYQRKTNEELKFYRDYYFIKFMEGLNKLNRADDRRCFSKATIEYLDTINSNSADQCIAINLLQSAITTAITTGSSGHGLQSANSSSTNKLNINSSNVNKIAQAIPSSGIKNTLSFKKLTSPKTKLYEMVRKYMEVQNDAIKTEIFNYLNQEYIDDIVNKSHGIPFIENKKDIPLNCFISAEAIWWCIEHVNEIENEIDAIIFMQILCDFDLIKHISNQQKVFIHGFYLYYIITPENRDHCLYTKDYCEVGFCDLGCMRSQSFDKSIYRVNDLLPDSKLNLPLGANEIFKSYLSIFKGYSNSHFQSDSPDSILKLVNVDVDPAHKSNRVEWASAVYRSNYHQLSAFELEIQWEMATGQLLSELVNGWGKLANRFNYHIVAAPIDPFALPIVPNSDPLRGPIIIKLNLNCLIQQNEILLFESYIDQKYKLDYSLFMTTDNLSNNESSYFSSSLPASVLVDQLVETSPAEFVEFLFKKFPDDSQKSREKIERKIQEEADFVEQEFQEFIERKRIFRLQYFQEAILEKYGFVRNASVVKTLYSDDDPTFFIHSSGGMFVCLPNYYGNYYTSRSRHTSSNSVNSTITTSTMSKTLITSHNKLNDSETHSKNEEIACSPTNLYSLENKFSMNHLIQKMATNSNGYNSPLSHSLASSSIINNGTQINNHLNSSNSRERSNTKSQHVQFLKLNEKNYLTNGSTNQSEIEMFSSSAVEVTGINEKQMPTKKQSKTDDEIKSDLLFKPKTATGYDIRLAVKSNEKLDLIQQQQREQMLLQSLSTTPNNLSSNLTHVMRQKNSTSDELSLANSEDSGFHKDSVTLIKKLPFYAEPDTCVGFSWSWNFMLGKKWRSQFTGDEALQDNMLADFRLFCSNKDGRLLKFYNECKELLN